VRANCPAVVSSFWIYMGVGASIGKGRLLRSSPDFIVTCQLGGGSGSCLKLTLILRCQFKWPVSDEGEIAHLVSSFDIFKPKHLQTGVSHSASLSDAVAVRLLSEVELNRFCARIGNASVRGVISLFCHVEDWKNNRFR
jgi:hypothetical protein